MSNLLNYSDTQKKAFGLPVQQLIYSCLFDLSECYPSEFEWVYDFYYGNCIRFNSKGNRSVNKNGKLSSLQLILFIGETKPVELSLETGIHIHINNQSERTSLYRGIDASPGKITNIALNKVITKKLASPYSECIDDQKKLESSIFYRKLVAAKNTYKQTDCFELCFSYNVFNECKCYEGSTVSYFSIGKQCKTLEDLSCLTNYYTKFYSNEIKKMCNCPLECNTVAYSITSSFSKFPSKYYLNNVILKDPRLSEMFGNKTVTEENIRESFVSIRIYFDELKYTLVNELEKFDVGDLISNIG
jgi:hypothetical protein